MTAPKHFLDLHKLDAQTLHAILALGSDIKSGRKSVSLAGKTLALIFEKPSTRTRVSFEVGMMQLGGNVVVMDDNGSQLGRGETVADTARVLSRYVDAIMIRTDDPAKLDELARHATVPVINGLTDDSHPCQLMADVMTYEEHRGSIRGKKVAWVGDGNNMAASFVHAAGRFGFSLALATPEELALDGAVLRWAESEGVDVTVTRDADVACAGADLVVTDTWVSMGDKDSDRRHALLKPYQVDARRMTLANADAVFMHCLPAHRDEEVTADVIDGPQSVIWDEAENRLHAQKGILAWCMG
ncbi:MAG: ornithine carbamoyltransferase [Alphaproteobacteria bacterium]|nr:ornithine carbamoyltransferase [Alphaproteobacteria bacterium]MBF0251312.1 ornithine carbamoyltransferase [Alphaproteobacteria bacterium]